jgi:hypothetical protein
MRAILTTAASVLVLLGVVSADVLRTFDDDPAGTRPQGFSLAAIRRAAGAGRWIVERNGLDGFLSHAADATAESGIDLAVLERTTHADLIVGVRLKLLDGKREGGLMWRARDSNNFYAARLDLLDQKMALDRVVRGNRIRIEGAEDLELDPTAWHVLRARHEDDRIRVYLGGVKVFDTVDRTFREAGGVGLWASGDSAAAFDDFRVEDR